MISSTFPSSVPTLSHLEQVAKPPVSAGAPSGSGSTVSMKIPSQVADEQSGAPVKFGVTDPISLKLPSARDRFLTQKLEAMMRSKNLYESEEGQKRREIVLDELKKLLSEWVSEVASENHIVQTSDTSQSRLFTFGSYRLGVVNPGGDIDALCVVPSFISREAFFDFFLAKLQQVNSSLVFCNELSVLYLNMVSISLTFCRTQM